MKTTCPQHMHMRTAVPPHGPRRVCAEPVSTRFGGTFHEALLRLCCVSQPPGLEWRIMPQARTIEQRVRCRVA